MTKLVSVLDVSVPSPKSQLKISPPVLRFSNRIASGIQTTFRPGISRSTELVRNLAFSDERSNLNAALLQLLLLFVLDHACEVVGKSDVGLLVVLKYMHPEQTE